MLKTLSLWSALLLIANGLAGPACAADVAGTTGEMTLHTRSRVESPKGSGQFDAVYKTVHWNPEENGDHHLRHVGSALVQVGYGPGGRDGAANQRLCHQSQETRRADRSRPERLHESLRRSPREKACPGCAGRTTSRLPEKCVGAAAGREGQKWPIDDSDGGCDCTPQCVQVVAHSRQIDTIKIADEDAISDSGIEIGNLFVQRGIENVMFMGVHTNMCMVGRPFGLRNLVRFGKNVVLVRDLTDAMYNPQKPPHVSHIRGTELVDGVHREVYLPHDH